MSSLGSEIQILSINNYFCAPEFATIFKHSYKYKLLILQRKLEKINA